MLIKKLASYKSYRLFGFPRVFPMNLTLGLSYRCNSKCKTCNIWKMKDFGHELSPEEFRKIFQSIGKNNLYLLILTGGEPFLHRNIAEIAGYAEQFCEPETIVIPTNCILGDYVVKKTEEILKKCRKSHITVNVSIDEIGKNNDLIRGIPGDYKRALETYKKLKLLEKKYKNFDVSIHTVISKFNFKNFPEIYETLSKLSPSNYITEIAEKRNELANTKDNITPDYDEYSHAIDYLMNKLKSEKLSLKQSLRIEYYKNVKRILKEKRQIIPCYAGIASAQIDPKGEVWLCCVRAESIGNIRDVDYNFNQLWYNKKAEKQRKSIANGECSCPLASANYTNLSLDFLSALKVIGNLIKSHI
jgi:MoaA/NifB/PqqE/SkfB family radical SAM enzyme